MLHIPILKCLYLLPYIHLASLPAPNLAFHYFNVAKRHLVQYFCCLILRAELSYVSDSEYSVAQWFKFGPLHLFVYRKMWTKVC